MKTKKIFSTLIIIMLMTTGAFAQHGRSMIQKERIRSGVQNGNINRHERRGLVKQQRYIRHLKMHAMADGKITRREKKAIRKAERRANMNIHRKKHNHR